MKKNGVFKELSPGFRKFDFPDFGFDDCLTHELNVRTDFDSFWQLLFEQIEDSSKFERLKSYVEEVSTKKLEEIA